MTTGQQPDMTAKRNPFSILLTGSTGSGKTSLLKRYADDIFSEEYIPTEWMGMNIIDVTVDGHPHPLRVIVKDADGRRQYESHSINYYVSMDAVILVYDVSNQESVECLKEMCELVKRYCKKRNKIPCAAVVGNKTDKEREVNQTDLKDFAEQENMFYIETSAKTGDNVKNMFLLIIKEMIERYCFPEEAPKPKGAKGIAGPVRHESHTPVASTDNENNSCSCAIL